MYLHADDFGITLEQARDILKLSDSCGGNGSLTSVSAFANSPAFPDAIALALPHARAGRLRVALHVNLVEGYPVAPADELDMLVDERGAFKLDFLGLLVKGAGPQRAKLADQIERECAAQIARFVAEFPESPKRPDRRQPSARSRHPRRLRRAFDGGTSAELPHLAHAHTRGEALGLPRMRARSRHRPRQPREVPDPQPAFPPNEGKPASGVQDRAVLRSSLIGVDGPHGPAPRTRHRAGLERGGRGARGALPPRLGLRRPLPRPREQTVRRSMRVPCARCRGPRRAGMAALTIRVRRNERPSAPRVHSASRNANGPYSMSASQPMP